MTRKRFDTAPQFNVDDEGLVIQQVAGSTAALFEIKDHTGSSLMSVDADGEMTTAAPSTIDALTITTSISVPTGTTIDSPNLTGIPVSPTAVSGTNTTQVATTAFVQGAIADLVSSAPAALNTLDELAAALGDDANFASTVTNSLADKAPLASPALTGTPTAPTAAATTNTTQIATTAFVLSVIPAGTVQDYAGTTEPAGWKFLNGQTLTGAQTAYPTLWNAVPATWKSGSNIVLPDARGRVSVAQSASGTFNQTLGTTGGVESVTLTAAESGVPAHSHANTLTNNAVNSGNDNTEHTHAVSGTTQNDSPDHGHGIGVAQEGVFTGIIGTSGHNGNVHTWAAGTGGRTAFHQHPFSATSGGRSSFHQHSVTSNVTISNVNNTASAASSAHTNLQPYIVLNKIIKVH